MTKIRFIKIRDVKSPERGHPTSSWIDFFIPNDLTDIKMTPSGKWIWRFNNWELMILPWEWALIPSWIKMIIDSWYDLVMKNKSWVAIKKGFIVWAEVIDSEYRWEVHIHIINTSKDVQTVELWQKIIQGILREVILDLPKEVSEKQFEMESNTNRGSGWFWSTWDR